MAGHGPGEGRPRRRRLSRSAEFERVYRQGRSKANRYLVALRVPARGRRRRWPAPRTLRLAPRRRRGRSHAREADPPRGVLGSGRAAPGRRGLRRRRTARRPRDWPSAKARRACGRALGELVEGIGARRASRRLGRVSAAVHRQAAAAPSRPRGAASRSASTSG